MKNVRNSFALVLRVQCPCGPRNGFIFAFSELARSLDAEKNDLEFYGTMLTLQAVAYCSARAIIVIIFPRNVAESFILRDD